MATERVHLLDWYGNPIEGLKPIVPTEAGGLLDGWELAFQRVPEKKVWAPRLTFREWDDHGRWRIVSVRENGEIGGAIDVADWYLRLENDSGRLLYDSRERPPPDAKLLPNYIGYEFERRMRRYAPTTTRGANEA